MLYSNLLKLDFGNLTESSPDVIKHEAGISAYCISIDTIDVLEPPDGLSEIGIIVELDEDGNVKEDIIDLVISYRIAKPDFDIILEIPFVENKEYNFDYLFSIATNLQVALSLRLPENLNENNFTKYKELLKKFSAVFFTKKNYSKPFFPLSNYIEYLFRKIISPTDNYLVSDPYILTYYHNILGIDRTNELKDFIYTYILEVYNGKENFENMVKSMFFRVYTKVKGFAEEQVKILESQREAS